MGQREVGDEEDEDMEEEEIQDEDDAKESEVPAVQESNENTNTYGQI